MAKPEWGIKRACRNCGTRFYDFKKSPIICPNCGTEHEIVEQISKPKKEKLKPKPEEKKPVKADVTEDESDLNDEDEDELGDIDLGEDLDIDLEDDEEDDTVLENADELGDDDIVPVKKDGPKVE